MLFSPRAIFLRWLCTSTTRARWRNHHLQPIFTAGRDYERALVSTLRSCATHLAVSLGQQIHCLVLKSGLDSNTFILNSLINMYAKCGFVEGAECLFSSCPNLDSVSWNIMISGYVKLGRLGEASHLFEKMPDKGCVSYTTMIMGFSQKGFWKEAVGVFHDMREAGVVPNEVTLGSLICACVHLGGIWHCRMLHALAIKVQLDELVLVSTNLLHMYCGCSSLRDASDLFNEMPERNIVSWNVLLNGYSKAGQVELARELFERIPAKDAVSWGTMIDGYVRIDSLSEALAVYRAMLRDGLQPTDVMIVDLLSACARVFAIVEGLQLHGRIVKVSFDSYDFIQATIIHFYAACGRVDLACLQFEVGSKDHLPSENALIAGFVRNRMLDKARHLFDKMPERDITSWSSMISGYAQSEQPRMALQLFYEMMAGGTQPNQITMVSVLSAIASVGSLDEGRWAHEYILNNSIPLNDNLSAAVIDMYAKCGSINTALEVFYQVRERTSTVSPWNAIICGLAMHGHANLSLEIYTDLEGRPFIKQNAITITGVLSACCHAGLVELGKNYFTSMKSAYNIDPDIKHYGCMVDLLGRAGRLEEADEMIRGMPIEADVVIWGTLLAACRKHGNVEIGEKAAENLTRLEPSHGGGRVLLSNIYADAGRWADVQLVRRTIQCQKVNKSPGYSAV